MPASRPTNKSDRLTFIRQATSEEWRQRLPCGDPAHDFPGEPALEEFARRVCAMPKSATQMRDTQTGYETITTNHRDKSFSPDFIKRANEHVRNCWKRECGKMTDKEVKIELNKLQKKSPDGIQTFYGDDHKLRQIAAAEGYDLIEKEDAKEEPEPRGSKSGLRVVELMGGLE